MNNEALFQGIRRLIFVPNLVIDGMERNNKTKLSSSPLSLSLSLSFGISQQLDNLAEWSKALDLGSNPKGHGFKSHSCHWLFLRRWV